MFTKIIYYATAHCVMTPFSNATGVSPEKALLYVALVKYHTFTIEVSLNLK